MGRPEARVWLVVLTGIVVGLALPGCARRPLVPGETLDLLAPDNAARWRPAPGSRDSRPWSLDDGVFHGHGSWVGHEEAFEDFVLECDFLFSDQQGGIAIRSDRDSIEPWNVGYELDIDWAPDRAHGHVHFPCNPKPYAGEVLFKPGVWHTLRIEARGPAMAVALDGKQVIRFTNDQFRRGHICLEGEEGGVKYRNLRVQKLLPR